jgi:hypothetical protein
MNTIAPAPQIKRLPAGKRAIGIIVGIGLAGVANVGIGYAGFSFWTRQTKFVPYDTSDPDFQTALVKKHNPSGNPPGCIDHAVRTVPFSKLKTTDQGQLTTDFCRGVWSGIGYAYQRRYLEKKYKALPGRENHLWDREELGKSEYAVGTKITDHFEVLEHSNDKVRTRRLTRGLLWILAVHWADNTVRIGHCAMR